jgi:RNA polymerase sigma-70 factor (ECF subfamily)
MGSRHSVDERLIEHARDGDRVAQQELWRAHRRWVAAIILAHRPRSVEVEDLLQDVAVKFIDKIHTLREARAFRPWLRQIALNVCRGAARTSRTTLRLGQSREDGDGRDIGTVAEPASADTDVQLSAERRDAAGRLMKQALGLPVAYREPLLLRCLRSMSYQQISDVMGLPVTTVETRLARARRMLREELGQLDVSSDDRTDFIGGRTDVPSTTG